MKQILQSLRTGKTEVADISCPAVKRGRLLTHATTTLVADGTHTTIARMCLELRCRQFVDAPAEVEALVL